MSMRGDELDVYRREYNKMLMDKTMGANCIMQVKPITISVAKKDIKEARSYFARIGADLTAHFAAFGSKCAELDADDRLRVFCDFFRPGDESTYSLSLSTRRKLGHDFRDYICPDSLEKHSDYLKIGNKFARVIFLKGVTCIFDNNAGINHALYKNLERLEAFDYNRVLYCNENSVITSSGKFLRESTEGYSIPLEKF